MMKDMTAGSPVRLILRFAAPMIFGYLLQQLYSMCDTVIVGKFLGMYELAGVGSTGAISFLVIGFCNGICTGLTIPAAQAFGAGDHLRMRQYIANGIYIAVGVAAMITIFMSFFTDDILRLMNTPEEHGIYNYAYAYIFTIFTGVSATILYNLSASVLRAVGDSKSPLIFLAIASILNILLDLFLILVLKCGVAGAGIATVIAQGISGLLCVIYIYRRYDILRLQKADLAFQFRHCLRLLSIGLPMALQFSITAIGSIILQMSVNGLGEVAVTAMAAASKIQAIVTGPMECLGVTMATYCGQNLGAGQFGRIQKGIRSCLMISVTYCILAAIGMFLLGRSSAYLFIDADETAVLDAAELYLHLNALFYPILGILFVLRNSLQGMGFSLLPMLAGVTELFARTAVCLIFVSVFGFMAAALASPAAWCSAVILLIAVYFVKMRTLRRKMTPSGI
ncbi:MAG: MATE family efflux transporter [Ruminococcus sp.]